MVDDTAPAAPLFTAEDLSDLLTGSSGSVGEKRARIVEMVVWGWLRRVLQADTRPDPVPEEIFAWAIELGAIAHENPAGKDTSQLGDETSRFSATRRAEILEEAHTSKYGTHPADNTSGGVPEPQGQFPAAEPYPDPARPARLGWPY